MLCYVSLVPYIFITFIQQYKNVSDTDYLSLESKNVFYDFRIWFNLWWMVPVRHTFFSTFSFHFLFMFVGFYIAVQFFFTVCFILTLIASFLIMAYLCTSRDADNFICLLSVLGGDMCIGGKIFQQFYYRPEYFVIIKFFMKVSHLVEIE